MNEIVNLVRLKQNKVTESLSALESQAKERFANLHILVGSVWHEDVWSYLKSSQKVKFQLLRGGELPEELTKLSKIFLVDNLWNQRLRKEPLSFSYIKHSIAPFKVWAQMGLERCQDINQNTYDETIAYLRSIYKEPASTGNSLNRVVCYLNDNHLLSANIDTTNIRKALGNTDEHGRVLTKKEKMPLPELVKAVIHLKWAVDDGFDGSAKAISDKLCILTQVFQYGLGLRLGEVLRLPKNPLVEMDGELFCRVWTEKGTVPMARYVPSIWRKPFENAIDEIHRLTKQYRCRASHIEEMGDDALSFIDERFAAFNRGKEVLLAQKLKDLDVLLESKLRAAKELWQLKIKIEKHQRYELKELCEILPIASKADDLSSLYKYYKSMGLEIVSESLGTFKNKHFVTGHSILETVARIIRLRSRFITERELLKMLNKNYSGGSRRSKDQLVRDRIERLSGNYNALTFAEEGTSQLASSVAVINRENAITILRAYVLGGYDYERFIPLKELENLLPELFNQKSASRNYVRELCGNKQHYFYVKAKSLREFSKAFGYLADINKVKSFYLSEYVRMNLDMEKELLTEYFHDNESEGGEISSRSFSIKQQPSEYLFIRAGMRGGVHYECLPQILGYCAVYYFFSGNDRKDSAFARYGVDVDAHIAESWQSHKGRHWQTTSLFRAGLAEMVVNKWMGRTSGQGENYDHNTGRERAEVIADAMFEDTGRFLGDVPNKVRQWKQNEIKTSTLPEKLTETLQSIQHSPLGCCTRSLYLKPCKFNLKCLTGNDGKGCKHYIYDLHDPSHREKLTAERDKSSLELSRLFDVYEKGVEAAKMHIQHHMLILRNTTAILDRAEIILNDQQLEDLQDYMPFKKDGSYPEDCPFQCGGEE